MYQYEGARGFWRGTLAPLGSLTFSRTLGFIAYRKAKYAIDRGIESTTGSSPLEWVNTAGTYPNLGTVVCFSAAGMVSGAVLTPILSMPYPDCGVLGLTHSSTIRMLEKCSASSDPHVGQPRRIQKGSEPYTFRESSKNDRRNAWYHELVERL